jgi:hypothetical protein
MEFEVWDAFGKRSRIASDVSEIDTFAAFSTNDIELWEWIGRNCHINITCSRFDTSKRSYIDLLLSLRRVSFNMSPILGYWHAGR